ncbi:hypothetical protein A2961_03475 [Candidatus Woesebacteria bacterium RIFCSPLOWO2_01_FULL_39_21]|uniref:Glycosyltransferase RgtA/B/C/D-like domain-containing protein n=1 Tax=Candidatus Woesebacteria bacterium RIFCSPLOWO2_01_FULL_39_21 TaxID=1802519 RepID=A0A1F8BEG1_9BACT|nr:MAG: hypothetical protein A2691_00505 [Candidatus Woesebacteria bacterium RIFCSPHIGHO2_01_FULL_39_23]OGM62403.1 MAG: hypothetical protein A2961_03475 [Candidatus Woesebacteria bacterium RIFCSPLOWO2_01_FULL_39_21]
MKLLKFINKKYIIFFFIFIFLAIIKLHEYERWPGPAHAEELAFGWAGINLIETGVPVSWSTLDYPESSLVFDGIVGDKAGLYLPAKLYKPWLDQPPLYSLLSGGAAHLFGDSRDGVLPSAHTRVPSVLISLLTMALVFYIAQKFFNYWVGILATVFYGTSPIIVFGSRLSVPENVFALAFIGSILLVKRYLDRPTLKYAILFGCISVLLGLMKPTGFFFAPLYMFFIVKKRRWQDLIVIFVILLAGIFAFFVYGYHYNWELFLRILNIQSTRFAGWSGLSYIFTTPAHDIYLLYDGWYIFCLFSAIYFLFNKNKPRVISLLTFFLVYWLLVVVFSGTEQDLLPWYRYPIFPILSVFGALGFVKLYKNPNFITTALLVGLLLSSRYLLKNDFRSTTPPNVFRATYALALLPSLGHLLFKKNWMLKLSKVVIVLLFALGVFFNTKYIYNAFSIRCENVPSCTLGPSTRLSEVHLPIIWRFFIIKNYNTPSVINPIF